MRELADLPPERDNVQAEQQLSGDIAGLEQQLQYQEKDLAATCERVKKLGAEISALQKVPLRLAIAVHASQMHGAVVAACCIIASASTVQNCNRSCGNSCVRDGCLGIGFHTENT